MNWIKENKKKVAAILLAVIAVFTSIAELTGTKTDDKIADKIKQSGIEDKLKAIVDEPETNAVDAVGSTE